MKIITRLELNETRGFKILVSEEILNRLKSTPEDVLIKKSEVPEYRVDRIEIGENYIQVVDRGYQNSAAPSGYGDATTTWTTIEWDKQPWE